MIAYMGTPQHDELLLRWWHDMRTSGDLSVTFMRDMHALGAFMAYWRVPGIQLVFEADASGIAYAHWFEPALSGAYVGVWARASHRCTKGVHLYVQVMNAAFTQWPILLCITKQDALRNVLGRLGWQLLGKIPKLWHGDTVYVFTITQDAHATRYVAREARNARRKVQ